MTLFDILKDALIVAVSAEFFVVGWLIFAESRRRLRPIKQQFTEHLNMESSGEKPATNDVHIFFRMDPIHFNKLETGLPIRRSKMDKMADAISMYIWALDQVRSGRLVGSFKQDGSEIMVYKSDVIDALPAHLKAVAKNTAIQELIDNGATEGERAAARHAMERLKKA